MSLEDNKSSWYSYESHLNNGTSHIGRLYTKWHELSSV